jgi:hypothetical protein
LVGSHDAATTTSITTRNDNDDDNNNNNNKHELQTRENRAEPLIASLILSHAFHTRQVILFLTLTATALGQVVVEYTIHNTTDKLSPTIKSKSASNAKRMAAGLGPAFPQALRRTSPERFRRENRVGRRASGQIPSPGVVSCPDKPTQSDPINVFTTSVDDGTAVVELPTDLRVEIYGQVLTSLGISSNGVSSLRGTVQPLRVDVAKKNVTVHRRSRQR